MKRLGVVMLLILSLALMGSSFKTKDNTKRKGNDIPGLGGDEYGNEQTIEANADHRAFWDQGWHDYTHIYLSADDGGKAPVGNDSKDGLTWSTAWHSLQRADTYIERTCKVVLHVDTDDGNDDWVTLAGEINNDSGTEWDGSIGPPADGCGGDTDLPAAVVLNSDKNHPWKIDTRNITTETHQEDCAGAGYGTNACFGIDGSSAYDDEGLFSGRLDGDSAANRDGWLWVEPVQIRNYPNTPEVSGSIVHKDYVAGNVLVLQPDWGDGAIPAGQVNLSSQHSKGFDIQISPKFRSRLASDFDEDCSTQSLVSHYGCIMNDSVLGRSGGGSGTLGPCTGNNTPYIGCDSANSDYSLAAPLFLPASGGTIVITDEDYHLSINHGPGTSQREYRSLFRALNATTLLFVGAGSTVINEAHSGFSPARSRTDDNFSVGRFEVKGDQADQAGPFSVSGVRVKGPWLDDVNWPTSLFEMDRDWTSGGARETTHLGEQWTLDLYDIRVDEIEYTLLGMMTSVNDSSTTNNEIHAGCVAVDTWSDVNLAGGGVVYFNDDVRDGNNDSFDFELTNWFLNDSLGEIGYLWDGTEPATVAALRTKFESIPEVTCDGSTSDCSTSLLHPDAGLDTSAQTTNDSLFGSRLEDCPESGTTIAFPTLTSHPRVDKTILLPRRAFGENVLGYKRGAGQ